MRNGNVHFWYITFFFFFIILLPVPGEAGMENEIMETEIGHLLQFIEDSGCIFVRNNKEYTSKEARDHIQKKYGHVKRRIKTAEKFIKYIATKSSMSGKLYKVHCKDKELLSGEWLNAELTRYRKENNTMNISK